MSDRFGLPALQGAWRVLGPSSGSSRRGPDVRTLVAASARNHGRAVARVAAMRGLRGRVYLPPRAAPSLDERRDRGEGADVVIVDGTYEEAVAAASLAGATDGVADVADVGTSDTARWVIDGYATLFDEARAHGAFDVLLVPIGVGSLGRRRPGLRRGRCSR